MKNKKDVNFFCLKRNMWLETGKQICSYPGISQSECAQECL